MYIFCSGSIALITSSGMQYLHVAFFSMLLCCVVCWKFQCKSGTWTVKPHYNKINVTSVKNFVSVELLTLWNQPETVTNWTRLFMSNIYFRKLVCFSTFLHIDASTSVPWCDFCRTPSLCCTTQIPLTDLSGHYWDISSIKKNTEKKNIFELHSKG